ncbi:MAG: SDR family oxidoreductase [Gammaproteobacteria bacterium]
MARTALVTGASRGIGCAIATRLQADGWRVVNFDILEPTPQADAAARWMKVDLADSQALVRGLADLINSEPIDALVNNAAIGLMAGLEHTTLADFERSVAINMRAPMLCAQAVLPAMKAQRWGRIINIASRAHLGKTERTAYAGTKGALVSMTKVWALELARFGITCNAVAPGPIATELFTSANPPEMPRTRAIIDAIPMGRLGQPADIANAVAFFVDERAGFITGQVLYVCGGVTLARGGS